MRGRKIAFDCIASSPPGFDGSRDRVQPALLDQGGLQQVPGIRPEAMGDEEPCLWSPCCMRQVEEVFTDTALFNNCPIRVRQAPPRPICHSSLPRREKHQMNVAVCDEDNPRHAVPAL